MVQILGRVTRHAFRRDTNDVPVTGQREDASIGLYFYNARYYDSSLGRFAQADTIVPQPGNPQSLNRYSYAANNPLRYGDPSGHDWVDAVNFLLGFAAQWASVNTWMVPQAQEALSVQPNEPVPMTVGRHLGNVATVVQGVTEMTGGVGLIGGGAVACGTGVLCPAGATAMVAGAAVAAHGLGVAGAGAVMEGQMLGDLFVQANTTCPSCGASNPKVRRGKGGIATRQHVENPADIGKDGVSAWCEGCGNNLPPKFWGHTVEDLQAYAQKIGLDPSKAAVYTPQYGGVGHYSLFIDAIGPDGYILPQYADLIDAFLRSPK